MLRFIAFCCFLGLFTAPAFAQQTATTDRSTSQTLSTEDAGLDQLSKDCLRFSTRLKSLKDVFANKETARVNAYYQQLLDAMRNQINLAMDAGEARKEDLAQMNAVIKALEGRSFDVQNPAAATSQFAELDKFSSIMESHLKLEMARHGK